MCSVRFGRIDRCSIALMPRFSPQPQALRWTLRKESGTISPEMTNNHDFDAIIVGGGLAGALCGVALAQEGFSGAIVDAADPAVMRGAAFDGRTSALSYATVRVFKRLGLWGAIKDGAEPIRDILVSDGHARDRFRHGAVSPFHLHFDSRELGEDTPLGWIVENRLLRDVLFDAIEETPSISLFAPARREGATRDAGEASVTLADGRILRGALIIAADGRHSSLRAEAGLKVNHWRYPQTGIVATVSHEYDHEGVAQEFFLPSGPFAILPMTNSRSSLVWTEREETASAFMALDDEALEEEIAQRFGPYLGDVRLAGPRWSYPLAFHLAQTYITPRLVLIGDAAHAIHPIAGQGFNLGIKDIAALADVLSEARSVGLDIGAMTVLQNYQRWRRFDSAVLAFGGDVINRLFSNDLPPVRLARDIGMSAVGKIKPLRQVLMRQAGADLGRLPKLMARES